ncbi:hypothetical protein RhiirA1_466788 [Rhizophagus irregularis]|uniref:Uncharacterized protein n=1 Tax=Rhizophagus irregularis TaxID=588596 RepID=A0A2N0RD88_9GLOM|nr:hypothetical protein RhiirA1_466788 [Rhizophagus irregularis]
MNLIKILTIISCFFFKVIIAQVPIYTFPIETVNYYVNGGNGIQIYVEEKGNTEKTTILFTSDYMSSRQSWHPLCWTRSSRQASLIVKYSIAAIDPDYKFSTIAYGLNNFVLLNLVNLLLYHLNIENLKFNVTFYFRDFFSSLDIPKLNLIREKDKIISLEHSLQFANLAKKWEKNRL